MIPKYTGLHKFSAKFMYYSIHVVLYRFYVVSMSNYMLTSVSETGLSGSAASLQYLAAYITMITVLIT